VWGRLWSAGNTPARSTPITLLPREDLDTWLRLAGRAAVGAPAAHPSVPGNGVAESDEPALSTYARAILDALVPRGACFTTELERLTQLLPSHLEMGLVQLIGHGRVTCDSFGGLRPLITSPSKRRGVVKRTPFAPAGRWSEFRRSPAPGQVEVASVEADTEFVGRRLLARYGVVFRRLLERESLPVPWRDIVRFYRRLELRGELRGGRFVQRFSGEQYALPGAVERMRRLRREGRLEGDAPATAETGTSNGDSAGPVGPMPATGLRVSAADPLNLEGILTPEPRIPAQARLRVRVA
jgi:ATP-dependent Lhr-like helicase